MAATDVVVRFIGDTSSVRNEVAKVEGTGTKLKSWAKGVGAAIGGAFVVSQVADMVKAASNLNETMNKTNVVFGTSAKSVVAWSETSAEAFGLSQQEALDAASGFGTLFSQLGIGAKETESMSTSLVGAAADIASFHNVAGGAAEVTQMMSSAFIGEYDALQKVVPTINAAAVEQKALAQTGKASAKELTQGEKAAATYALVLEGMGPAAGDFAETSDSMANATRTASAQWKDAQAQLGQALLPAVTEITQALAKLAGWMADNTSTVLVFAAAVGVLGVAVLIATHPVAAIVLGIAALVAGIVWAYQNVEIFRNIVQTAFEAIKVVFQVWWAYVSTIFDLYVGAIKVVLGVIQTVYNWIKDNWPTLAAILAGPIGIAVALIIKHWDTIKSAAQAVLDWIKSNWPMLLAILTGPIGIAVGLIIANWNTIKNAATDLYNWVADKFRALAGVISSVVGGITGAVGQIVNALKAPINAVIRGWNNLEFKVPEVDLGPFGKIGGQSWGPPNITPLASGGIVTRPTLALVGERGPEAVIPLDRKSGGGGTVINLNVSVGAGVDPAQTGRTIVQYLQAYERANGRDWRTA
jgi:phage-related protein